MSFKNGKYFYNISPESVDNAISPVNEFANVRMTYFRHSPAASRIFRQNCFSMVNKGIHKPDRALQTVTGNERLDFSQIFASFL